MKKLILSAAIVLGSLSTYSFSSNTNEVTNGNSSRRIQVKA
jgi:hypothetical protein